MIDAVFIQQNREGNVTHLFNYIGPSASLVEKYKYDAFGALNKPASGGGNPFLFTGRRYQSLYEKGKGSELTIDTTCSDRKKRAFHIGKTDSQ